MSEVVYQKAYAALLSIFDSAEETDEPLAPFETNEIAPILFILIAFACFLGVASFPVFVMLALMILMTLSSQFFEKRWYRYVLNLLVVNLALWFVRFAFVEGLTSSSGFVMTLAFVLSMVQLRLNENILLAVSGILTVLSLWSPGAGIRFSNIFTVLITFCMFVYEGDVITRTWYTSQSSAKAEVQRAITRKEELSMEEKGAVKSAVHRLFLKAFGNYDQFSTEVAKQVKEVESHLSKEALKQLKEKEVDFSAFELERKLASGGFCTVFRGKWKQGNRQCAVKSFSSADRLDTAGLRGLVNEVAVLTTLNHNHIVKVLGYCWSPQVCLVMEYMQKGTLHDMLAYKALSISWEAPLLSLAIQISDAISYLHTRNPPIIHRDIKARNILMKDFRTCKLADFGLMVEEGSDQARAGTLRYVAPEVVNRADDSQQNTTRADMWSFGVCLWEMATRAQFSGLPPSYVLFTPAPRTLFVSKLPYRIPNVVYDVLEECLRPDPDTRKITATESHAKLKAALGTLEDSNAWFDDQALTKLNIHVHQAGSQYAALPPDDLSVDASMSWRADTLWRRGSTNTMRTSAGASQSFLDLSQQAITSRLALAEANNSRQLGALPVLENAPLSLPVHERLGVLSRLAEAETSSKEELSIKVATSRTLGDGSCRLLNVEFHSGTVVAVKEERDSSIAEPVVTAPNPAARLGLLSRLALAENRTKIEAETKFIAIEEGAPFSVGPNNSRLLESLTSQVDDLPVMCLPGGQLEMHHRLGLMARLADAETDATVDLNVKVSSQRTLDESCPLLKTEYPVLEETVPSKRPGSTSSLEGRFIARLGSGSSSNEWSSSNATSPNTALESRFLGRLGGEQMTSPLPQIEPLSAPQFTRTHVEIHTTVATHNPAEMQGTGPSGPPLMASGGMLSRLAQAEKQAFEPIAQPLQRGMKAEIELMESRSSEVVQETISGMLYTDSNASYRADELIQVRDSNKTDANGNGERGALGLLSRLAAAEARAVVDLEERVKVGATNVSCSLLSFPMDERLEEEEEKEEETSTSSFPRTPSSSLAPPSPAIASPSKQPPTSPPSDESDSYKKLQTSVLSSPPHLVDLSGEVSSPPEPSNSSVEKGGSTVRPLVFPSPVPVVPSRDSSVGVTPPLSKEPGPASEFHDSQQPTITPETLQQAYETPDKNMLEVEPPGAHHENETEPLQQGPASSVASSSPSTNHSRLSKPASPLQRLVMTSPTSQVSLEQTASRRVRGILIGALPMDFSKLGDKQ